VAVQVLAELQDTPDKVVSEAPEGFGVDWIVHVLPLNASANAEVTVPAPLMVYPTAVQVEVAVHDTPSRALPEAPEGFGVDWTFQLVPFHASANVRSLCELLS
jgi:hypothetical protein